MDGGSVLTGHIDPGVRSMVQLVPRNHFPL